MNVHSKKAHEWMVGEIKEEFICKECETVFPDKISFDRTHEHNP